MIVRKFKGLGTTFICVYLGKNGVMGKIEEHMVRISGFSPNEL